MHRPLNRCWDTRLSSMLAFQDRDKLTLTLSFGSIGLWLYLYVFHRSRHPHEQHRSSTQTHVFAFLLAHSAFTLFSAYYGRPTNVFSNLNIPLNEPADSIRATLLHVSKEPSISTPLERLVSKLNSFDSRIAYIRCVSRINHIRIFN